jgi:hypothetical protein
MRGNSVKTGRTQADKMACCGLKQKQLLQAVGTPAAELHVVCILLLLNRSFDGSCTASVLLQILHAAAAAAAPSSHLLHNDGCCGAILICKSGLVYAAKTARPQALAQLQVILQEFMCYTTTLVARV